ncbi:MAG: hypothetical protein GY935_19230 [Gammaproteobacteria bacterium]|nr:hypothetical protein [Gammaproteobacteria bacterium]
MKAHSTQRQSSALLLIGASLLWATAGVINASESDPWTYAYIPLQDSAPLVSDRLSKSILSVIEAVNAANGLDHRSIGDTELEFDFFAEFRSSHIRDLTWGTFERCIGTNTCEGWPPFERIQMYPEESVYRAANWRFIPSRFHLASVINVCGVRMGADKLTHFFDDGFHYFNALRSKRKDLDPEDIRLLSMAFEKTYMGTRLTGIVSRADIEANLAGVQFYSDFFIAQSPLIGRAADGRLTLLRGPDICDYVTQQYDERILPNEFEFSLINTERAQQRSQKLKQIIAERNKRSANMANKMSTAELALYKRVILSRRIPMTHWQSEFPKIRLVGHAAGMTSQWLFDPSFRRVSSLFGFDPLKPNKLEDRKPVNIRRTQLTYSIQ